MFRFDEVLSGFLLLLVLSVVARDAVTHPLSSRAGVCPASARGGPSRHPCQGPLCAWQARWPPCPSGFDKETLPLEPHGPPVKGSCLWGGPSWGWCGRGAEQVTASCEARAGALPRMLGALFALWGSGGAPHVGGLWVVTTLVSSLLQGLHHSVLLCGRPERPGGRDVQVRVHLSRQGADPQEEV